MITPLAPLLAGILERHADLTLVGGALVLLPIRHVFRSIFFDAAYADGLARVYYVASPAFVPGQPDHLRRYVGSQQSKFGPAVATYDPAQPSHQLDLLIETDVLPLLRSMELLEPYYRFAIQQTFTTLRPRDHLLIETAMGNFDAARMLVRWHRGKRFDVDGLANKTRAKADDIAAEVCRLLEAEEYAAIAKLLHEAERTTIQSLKLKHLWRATPFPFEGGAE